MALAVAESGLDAEGVPELVAAHLALMRQITPPEFVFALDSSGLAAANVTFLVARDGDRPVGCGALARLSATDGEIKSMHVLAAERGKGHSRALLAAIEDRARAAGLTRLWLETGFTGHFAAAQGLYRAAGYVPCGPFADYVENGHSAFFTKTL